LAFAFVRADRFAAAAETFALVLAAARSFLSRMTAALAAASVVAAFALSLAFIQATAQMNVARRGRRDRSRWRCGWLAAAAEDGPGGKPADGGAGKLVEIAPIQTLA
jgi:hypothetical protein